MASVSLVPKPSLPERTTPNTQQKSWEEVLYPRTINEDEIIWRDRYTFFHERGWELRPRYRPNWKPSWLGTSMRPVDCEDSIYKLAPIMILDAKSVANGALVCLKGITRRTKEIEIGQFLSSKKLMQDPNNHCVPILDAFQDPVSPDIEYIVMPLLRPFDDPGFWVVGEAIDFITQMIEGLVFLHSHRVFHGDLTGANIMMDARPIFPNGWHPIMLDFSMDGYSELKPLARIDHPVRYYIIDYDSSIRILPGESHYINDLGGRDQEVPELSLNKPIDVFKVDVFTLGNVFFKDFYQKYSGLEFLIEFIEYMKTTNPAKRPTAQEAFHRWQHVKSSINPSMIRWRLRKPDEWIGERVALDTYAMAHHGIQSMKRLFQAQSQAP